MTNVQLFAVIDDGPLSLPLPGNIESIHQVFDDLPIGVYTAFRTFEHNKFLYLEDHLNRLDRSMALLGWVYRLDRPLLRQALHQCCSAYPSPDARVRIDVLARAPIQLATDSRLLFAMAPYEPEDARIYEEGVKVGLTRQLHRSLPMAKKADFVLLRQQYLKRDPAMYEFLMVGKHDTILEGTSSNFYGVKDGILWTASAGVLEGVARKIVLQVAGDLGIPIRLEAVRVDDIFRLDEAALSSSSRAIVPIVAIDGQMVGNGRPGPITNRLLSAYRARLAQVIRPAVDQN